jgi:hypothetical protein
VKLWILVLLLLLLLLLMSLSPHGLVELIHCPHPLHLRHRVWA